MEQPPKNLFDSSSPEQKLAILCAEMVTPVAIIQGCAAVIKKHFEAGNKESTDLMDCIEGITKSADKIKELLDELGS
jgi:hypothetical protein